MDLTLPTEPTTAMTPPTDDVRRRRKRLLIALMLLVIFVGGALFAVTRPTVLALIVQGQLSKALGGEVTVGAARWTGGGNIQLDEVTVLAPDWPGEAGRVLQAGRIEATISRSRLLAGKVVLKRLAADDVVVRVAEREDAPGVINLLALDPPRGSGDGPTRIPRLSLPTVTLEMGVSDADGGWTRSGALELEGDMQPADGEWIAVNLRETGVNDGGLLISGRFHPGTLEHDVTLGRLHLDESRRGMLPLQARAWWERLDLTGEILGAKVRVKEGDPIQAEVRLGKSRMQMPVETGAWARLHEGVASPTEGRPHLEVDAGTLRLNGLRISLDRLSGSLIGTDPDLPIARVPFEIDFSLTDLPPLRWEYRADWLDDALAAAAFDLSLNLREFTVAPGDDGLLPAVELPSVVADALTIFRLAQWRMSTNVRVRRDAPTLESGADGDAPRLVAAPTRIGGQAYISQARGAYRRFIYPMHDVAAHLTFDTEQVTVNYLTGRGPNGATISASGSVGPPGPGAGVELRVSGSGLPIDDALLAALPDGVRRTVTRLAHERSARTLRAAGLLPDESRIELALQRRAELRSATAAATAPGASAAIDAELETLDRLLEFGAFTLGGTIDVEVGITRAVGGNQSTQVNGEITLDGLGVVLDRFPYPFRIVEGVVRLSPDHVDLGENGLRIATIGGGMGRIEGRIDMPRVDGRRQLRPDLRVKIAEERPNPAMFAAIPPLGDERESSAMAEWPGVPRSRTARIVEAFGIDADIATLVQIDSGDDGRLRWNALVDLERGVAHPDTAATSPLRDLGIRLPDAIHLANLSGQVHIDPDVLELRTVSCMFDDSPIAIDGTIGFGPRHASDLGVRLSGIELTRSLLTSLPEAALPAATKLWELYQPEGFVDARVLYERPVDGAPSTSVVVEPRVITLAADGERVTLRGDGGWIHSMGTVVTLDMLQLAVRTGELDDGRLYLDGSSQYGGETWRVSGRWDNGSFASPIIRELLARLGLHDALALTRRVDPAGRFDAEFAAGTSTDEGGGSDAQHGAQHGPQRLAHEVRIVPRDLALTLGDHRLQSRLDHDGAKPGIVRIVPGAIELVGLRGTIDDDRAAVHGTISLLPNGSRDGAGNGGGLDAVLHVSLDATGLTPAVRSILPAAVREPIDAIELTIGDRLRTAESQLRFRRTRDGWDASLDGTFSVGAATFRAGLSFEELDAEIDVKAGGGSGRPAALHADARFSRVRAVGRRITDGSGTIRLDEAGRTMMVENLQGETYHGRIEAHASVGLAEGMPYEAAITVAGAGLAGMSRGESAEAESDDGATGGSLTGRIGIAGTLGEPASRRGRGGIQVRDARMAEAPITLRLLQVIQLMLPLSGSLETADISFFIDGDRLTFERLDLQSDTLRLVGSGGMDLDGLILDTRFSSRGTLVIFSDLMGGLTDQLFAIEVTGPLDSPRTRVLPLPGLGPLPAARDDPGTATTPSSTSAGAGVPTDAASHDSAQEKR